MNASTKFLYCKDSLGFFILYRMSRCAECHHVSSEVTTHDRCRSHADCVQDLRYYAAFCGVCQGLWSRAREYVDNKSDATEAFDQLLPWITGFAKNSKGRTPGTDFFIDPEEHREFIHLKSIFRPKKRASSLDSSRSSIPPHRVSLMDFSQIISNMFKVFLL